MTRTSQVLDELDGLTGITVAPHGRQSVQRGLIVLHGYAGDCTEQLPLAQHLSEQIPSLAVFLPNAPSPCVLKKDAREWFGLTSNLETLRERILQVAPLIARLIVAFAKHHELTRQQIGLAGFSQGAMLALHVGLRERVGAIVSFSGCLACDLEAGARALPPVFVAHGARDRLMPPRYARYIRQQLTAADGHVTMHLDPELGHAVSTTATASASRFLETHLC